MANSTTQVNGAFGAFTSSIAAPFMSLATAIGKVNNSKVNAALTAFEGAIGTAFTTLQSTVLGVVQASTTPTSSTPPVVTSTPTASVPSTPVSTGTSTGISTVALMSDDFTSYKTTTDLINRIQYCYDTTGNLAQQHTTNILYSSALNYTLLSLDPTVLYNGHQTVKYTQPTGTSLTPQLAVTFPNVLNTVWLRTKIRFSAGFTTAGTLTNSANAYKLLSWTHDTYDGSGRVEITNTTQYQVYWDIQAKNTGTLVGGGQYVVAGNITTEWTDTGWYDYILKIDRSQNTVGYVTMWLAKDGQTPVLKGTTPAEKMNDGSAMPHVTGVSLGLNFNQTRKAAQALWFGQWEVIDGSQYANPYNL